MVRDARRALAALLCLAMLVSIIVLLPSSPAATPTRTLFTEDFEDSSEYRGEWPGTLPDGWDIGDRNSASGNDTWSRTTYSAFSGTYAAWAARATTHTYNANMDAYMRRPLGNLSDYSAVSVTFVFCFQTGGSAASGDDYLSVSVNHAISSSPPDQAADQVIWKQPAANISSWQKVTVNIPLDSTWISFNFHSGPAAPAGQFIGPLIDDISVQGTDDLAPVSHIGSMPAMLNDHVFPVPVDITARGGDVASVKLYYRLNGTGDFALYTTASNPPGTWAKGDAITFAATTDGRYEFFSLATDLSGNTEPMKSAAEAAVLVDTVRPYSAASVSGDWGNAGWYNTPAAVNLTAGDGLSGVAAIRYRVDGGSWSTYAGNFSIGSDGDHLLEYYAQDKAGNQEETRSAHVRVDRTGPTVELEQRSVTVGSGNLEVKLKFTDPASGPQMAQVSLDGGAFQSVDMDDPQASFGGLSEGTHTMVVRAWDFAGNMAETSQSFDVKGSPLGGDAAVIIPLGAVAITFLSLVAILLLSRRRR